ncbi:MAG TPA: hypothetical protein VFO62_00460, partial [Candidatus Binatia bacterium]|nr:hypothetical protein [Candidatus Binatia bacterium]
MKTITVQGLPFELHDDGVVAVPPGTAMSAGAILPLSVLREFVRRVEPKRRPNGKIKSTSYEIEEWRGRRWLVRADFP